VALALAERVKVQPAVFAEHLAGNIDDFTGRIRQVVAEEIAHFHLAEETNALAVLFFGDRQMETPGDLSHLAA
jgi:hypothetical protein